MQQEVQVQVLSLLRLRLTVDVMLAVPSAVSKFIPLPGTKDLHPNPTIDGIFSLVNSTNSNTNIKNTFADGHNHQSVIHVCPTSDEPKALTKRCYMRREKTRTTTTIFTTNAINYTGNLYKIIHT